jgi:tRNA A64-2'-O-ribosylphosphate transferase
MFPKVDAKQTDKEHFLPVICVSASKQIDKGVERRTSGFSYIQGSGDDHELWGMV